jgi:hypothetical protein
MAKDSILVVLCSCTSLFRKLYKEGKHTFCCKASLGSSGLCLNNNSIFICSDSNSEVFADCYNSYVCLLLSFLITEVRMFCIHDL